MKLVERHSHLNGLEYLLARKPRLWEELTAAIESVDAAACERNAPTGEGRRGGSFYSPRRFSARFCRLLRGAGWEDRGGAADVREGGRGGIGVVGDTDFRRCSQTDFVKDRVAVEVEFGNRSNVACGLFAGHLALYVRDRIDVGVEILPMKSLQSQMSSGVAYFEGEFYNVVRQGRGVPAVPLVLIGLDC